MCVSEWIPFIDADHTWIWVYLWSTIYRLPIYACHILILPKLYVNILAPYRRAITFHKLQCTYMNLLSLNRRAIKFYKCINLLILINLMWLITHSLPYQSNLVYNNQMDFASACIRPCVHGISSSIYDWQFSIITWCAWILKCRCTSIISS